MNNADFYTIYTLIPCGLTGITKPLHQFKIENRLAGDLGSLQKQQRIFNGRLYGCDKEYNTSFYKQENINKILEVVTNKSLPSMLSVTSFKKYRANMCIPKTATFTEFGSYYQKYSGPVYCIKFVIEEIDSIGSAKDLSQLLQGSLAKIPVRVSESKYAFMNTLDKSSRNTVIIKNTFD